MVKEAFENNVLQHDIELVGQRENITLYFISDIHVRQINKEMIQGIKKKVDAVIIGGDLADKRTPVERIYANLHLLTTLGPTYFVWGNNDREVGETRLKNIFEETGVQIIENDAVLLKSKNKVWLSAVDFTVSKNTSLENTFKKCKREDYIIFIAHNPQVFPKVQEHFKVDFLMGGHLHGGQIRFGPFGIHPRGSFLMKNGVPTLISNGYGTTLVPMRLGAKPESHLIDIKFQAKS